LGYICTGCMEALHQRNPEHFPAVEEYEEALRRYPEPIWATTEEAHQAELDLGSDRFNEVAEEAGWHKSTR
jgi:hypothetical protein